MKYLCLLLCLSLPAQAQFVIEKSPALISNISINSEDLCRVANNTLSYMHKHGNDDFAVHAGEQLLAEVTLEKVKETLAYSCQLPSQSLSTAFLLQNFDFYRWLPDKAKASQLAKESTNNTKKRLLNNIPADQIFLTKYYTKLLKGSPVKTEYFNQALYAVPYDESDLSAKMADEKRRELTRFQYTRQDIIQGAFERKQLAKPLVWVTEAALHDVLLQGTGVLEVDGKRRYFNVARNNGIAYDYTLGKTEQARYWYFAEVSGVLGYGTEITNKIPIAEEIAFAGNVKQLGLGKLILVQFEQAETPSAHLGILADQGGAFDDNLFQLDWLRSSYYGWTDYYQANKHFPDYATAWILLKK